MAICSMCGNRFNLSKTRQEYYDEFAGDPDYDEIYEDGDVCADCAIPDTHGNMAIGMAIDMVNGEEDYDDNFVQKWL